MISFRCLAFLLVATAAVRVSAVVEGDTYQQVLAEKGKPRSQVEFAGQRTLTYPDQTITVKGGKVIAIKPTAEAAASAEKSAPTGPKVGANGTWTTDYQAALGTARTEQRKVFVFFTGSDWCGWCMKLDDEVLSTGEFKAYAAQNLVLVKLDFPRKARQSKQLKDQNRKLAERYQIEGYPTVIVLNAAGKKVGQLGYQEGGPKAFIKALQKL